MIRYKSIKKTETGYKYELIEAKGRYLGSDFLGYDIELGKTSINADAFLFASPGFKWDGATGGIDSADFMESSMFHDAVCNMFDAGLLPMSLWGAAADMMRDINKAEGMPWVRRQWTWAGVRIWGRIKKSLPAFFAA